MRNIILVLAIFILVAGMLILLGCDKCENCYDNGNGDNPDTTIVPDTTQADSTGFGTMELVNELATEVAPGYVQKSEDLLIVSTTTAYSIEIYSLSDPENPEYLGKYPEYGFTYQIGGFDARDDVVYAAALNVLYAIDITDPSSPQLLGQMALGNQPQCVAAGDDIAFVGYGASAQGQVIDVSNPASMSVLATVPIQFSCCDYFYEKLYCASTSGSVYAVDVSVPDSPQVTGSCNSGGQNLDITVTPWGFLYIAGGVEPGTNNARFVAYDIRDIGMELHSETLSGFSAKNIAIQDNFAYLILRPQSGVNYALRTYFAYYLDNAQLAFTDTIVYANDVDAGDGYVYVGARASAGSGGTIYIYRHDYD